MNLNSSLSSVAGGVQAKEQRKRAVRHDDLAELDRTIQPRVSEGDARSAVKYE